MIQTVLHDSVKQNIEALMAIAGTLALTLTTFAVSAVTTNAPASIPSAAHIEIDWRVFTFSAVAAAFAVLLCCLAPAWNLIQTEPLESLKSGAPSVTESNRRIHLREWIVGLEVALSTVLLMIAALLIASFFRVVHADKGLDITHVLTQDVSFLSPKYAGGARCAVVEDLQEKLAAIPGVTVVGAVNHLPLIGEDWIGDLVDADAAPSGKQAPAVNFSFVTPATSKPWAFRSSPGVCLRNRTRINSGPLSASKPHGICRSWRCWAFMGSSRFLSSAALPKSAFG